MEFIGPHEIFIYCINKRFHQEIGPFIGVALISVGNANGCHSFKYMVYFFLKVLSVGYANLNVKRFFAKTIEEQK